MKSIYFLFSAFIFLFATQAVAQSDFSEPDFINEGLLIQNGNEEIASATEAHFETYADWSHDQRYAVRIKEMGKEGTVNVEANTPSKLIVRTGFNDIAPANVFSLIPFKQKKKQRNIDFIGFYREHKVSSETQANANVNIDIADPDLFGNSNIKANASANSQQRIKYANLPDFEDRFPQSSVKISGKKLGNESYILNIPALEKGEYALCYKDSEGVLMIIDLSVK